MSIVVYSSHTGSTKKYAELFAERTGLSCYSADDQYGPDESIIYFGWLNGPKITGLDGLDQSKVVAIATVSLDDPPEFGWEKVTEVNKIGVPMFHLRGWIDRSKLKFSEKLFFALLCLVYRLKGLDDHTRPLYDAMQKGGSFFDESGLEEIVSYISSIEE